MNYKKWLRLLLAASIFSLMVSQTIWANDASQCISLYQNDQFEEAGNVCLKAANNGTPDAQFYLGFMYHTGQGKEQSDSNALKWYRKAAEKKQTNAEFNLGVIYENGQSVDVDLTKAAHWYRKAAEQGGDDALATGGVVISTGQPLASKLWDKAKKLAGLPVVKTQTDAERMFEVGLLHRKSEDNEKPNYHKNIKWWREALSNKPDAYLTDLWKDLATKGDAASQLILGDMYDKGIGVESSIQEAVIWYKKAALHWNFDASKAFHFRYVKAYRTSELNDDLERCISVARTLLKSEKWTDAVNRVGACQYHMGEDSFDDGLQYLHSSLQMVGEMLYSLNWVNDNKFSRQNKTAMDFRKTFVEYIHLRKEFSLSQSNYERLIVTSLVNPFMGLSDAASTYGYNNWKTKDFEISHPSPTLQQEAVSAILLKMNAVKKLLQIDISFIKSWYQKADGDQIKYLMDDQSMVDMRIADLKMKYELFLSNDVVEPILLRTDQLLFIADKQSWLGSDDKFMEMAAKMLARLDQGMILNANENKRERFFHVFKKFKDQAGEAQMESLKAIQDITISDSDSGGSNRWWKGQ